MEGLVINTISYKEKSKIVYLYTPNGIKSIKALDVMKKNLGFTVTLNHVEFMNTNSTFPTLIEYSLIKSYYNINEDLNKLQTAIIIIDLIKKLEGEYPHNRIFPFVIKCLDNLMICKNPNFILSLFLIKMLYVFGVKPSFINCVKCGNSNIVDFNINDGGCLCDRCGLKNENNLKILEWFYRFYKDSDFNEDEFNDINYKQLLKSIYDYYQIHVNVILKSINFNL